MRGLAVAPSLLFLPAPMRRAAYLLLLLPTLASAQSTFSTRVENLDTFGVTAQDCTDGTPVTVTWTVNLLGIPCSPASFWLTSNTCGTAPAAGDVSLTTENLATGGSHTATFKVDASKLPGFNDGDGGTRCGE